MIFSKAIPIIEKAIGYKFKDKGLLAQAFTRTSFCNEAAKDEYQSNEVLEFLGDSVLSTAIITKLLSDNAQRFAHGLKTDFGEGEFSNIKSNLSDKKNLSRSMSLLGLQKFLIMGEGDAKLEIENEPSVMEDLFESIVGAVYLDCGMSIPTVMSTVAKMLDVSAYTAGEAINRSAKNALQEFCADKSRRLPVPRYETLAEAGPDHKKVYTRACYIGDRLCGKGEGKNFKAADAVAAANALALLKSEAGEAKKADKPTAKERNDIKKSKSENVAPRIKEGRAEKKKASPELAVSKDSPIRLKELAARNKLPPPQFKDLGEVASESDGRQIFRVECRIGEIAASADAYSKTDARAIAASKLLSLISKKSSEGAKKVSEERAAKANPHKRETKNGSQKGKSQRDKKKQ